MSIQCMAGKLKGEERKAIIQGVQKQLQEAALGVIKPRLSEFCEEELTVKLGRGKRESRRVGGQAREIEWQCGTCGCRDANHFTRDGHYQRALETGWGHVELSPRHFFYTRVMKENHPYLGDGGEEEKTRSSV